MPKTTTYICPKAPGEKRASARLYTHAVIARFDRERFERELEERIAAEVPMHTKNFAYYRRVVDGGVGSVWSKKFGYKVDQKMFDEYSAMLAKQGETLEAWLAYHADLERKRTAEALAKDKGEFYVLQWSQSFANAQKGMSGKSRYGYHAEMQVAEVIPQTKGA